MMKTEIIDADGFARNERPALVILDISKTEILACNTGSALERLLVLTDSLQNVRLYRESLLIQVRGYDDDSRELFEVPEVRTFFRRLTQDFPHWFWFLHRRVGAITLVLSLLCEVKVTRERGGVRTEVADPNAFLATVEDLFRRGQALFDTYRDITDAEIAESTESVLAELGA